MTSIQNEVDRVISEQSDLLEKKPFEESVYDRYIELLRISSSDNIQTLLQVREAKLKHFALKRGELTEWLEDLDHVEPQSEKIASYVEFYGLLVEEYPVAEYWSLYLEYIIGIEDRDVSREMVRKVFSQALNDVAHDYKDSFKVWDIVLQYFSDEYETTQDDDMFRTLLALHLKRISYPNLKLDDYFSEYSSFISKYDPKNYDTQLNKASKVYSSTKKRSKYIEAHEIQIIQNPDDLQYWVDYLENVHKFIKDDLSLLNTIFNRFVHHFNLTHRREDSKQVWLKYIYLLYDSSHESVPIILEQTLFKFVRSFPESSITYSEFIRNCSSFERSSESFNYIVSRSKTLDWEWENSYDQWKVIALSILTHRYHLVSREGIIDEVGSLYHDIETFVARAFENNDVFHSVEKLAISIYTELDDHEQATKLVERLIENFPAQSDVWLYAFQFYKSGEVDVERLRKIYTLAIVQCKKMDWPQKIIEDWFHFEQIHGDIESYRRAVVVSNKVIEEISFVPVEEERRDVFRDDAFITPKSKSKPTLDERVETKEEEPKRSRESFVIEASNLAPDTSELSLESFFKNCGTIRNINISKIGSTTSASIEFSSEQEVFTALTRSGKTLDGSVIKVARKLESTVFIANYPPSMQQDEVKDLFSQAGDIVSVRFPSQNSHRARRFCYVEFASSTDAKRAVALFNESKHEDKLSKKQFELKVAISDPSRARDPPNERTVRLNNLPFSFGQEDISKFLQKYGPIERIAVPLKKGHSSNHQNDGFAFVTFKLRTDAELSLKSNGEQVLGRVIEVSKQRKSHQEDFSKFDEAKTVGITNLDETLTSEQIEVYFAKEVGAVAKISLIPEHSVALIEFDSASDSGKAVLQAEKLQLGSKKLVITAKADVIRIIGGEKEVPKKRNLMVPSSVQRKRPRNV